MPSNFLRAPQVTGKGGSEDHLVLGTRDPTCVWEVFQEEMMIVQKKVWDPKTGEWGLEVPWGRISFWHQKDSPIKKPRNLRQELKIREKNLSAGERTRVTRWETTEAWKRVGGLSLLSMSSRVMAERQEHDLWTSWWWMLFYFVFACWREPTEYA